MAMWPPNFWALNSNSFNMVEGTDFKFDKHVPWDSPDRSLKILSKTGRDQSRDPQFFLC